MAGAGAAGDPPGVPREAVTDPTLDEVLRAAGFEVSDAARQRWRRQLASAIPPAALAEARRMLDRARGRAA